MDPLIKKVETTILFVAVFSAISLTITFRLTKPIIDKNRAVALEKGLSAAIPAAISFKKIAKDPDIYKAYNRDSLTEGYSILGKGSGYQGMIHMVIGTDSLLRTIKKIRILENVETPGLGAKIMDSSFLAQFEGLSLQKNIAVVQNKKPENNSQIRAITGATISSRSVVKIINSTVRKAVKKLSSHKTAEEKNGRIY